MSFTAEGTVEIDLCDLHAWIVSSGRVPSGSGDSIYGWGPPRLNESNGTLEIDFAMDGNGNSPSTWAEKPNALKQWDNLNKNTPSQ